MIFENVVVITQTGVKKIPMNRNTLYCGPMRIGEIEYWEDILIKNNVPYLLAQVETVMPRQTVKKLASMYRKGYCIFVKNQHREK